MAGREGLPSGGKEGKGGRKEGSRERNFISHKNCHIIMLNDLMNESLKG